MKVVSKVTDETLGNIMTEPYKLMIVIQIDVVLVIPLSACRKENSNAEKEKNSTSRQSCTGPVLVSKITWRKS